MDILLIELLHIENKPVFIWLTTAGLGGGEGEMQHLALPPFILAGVVS